MAASPAARVSLGTKAEFPLSHKLAPLPTLWVGSSCSLWSFSPVCPTQEAPPEASLPSQLSCPSQWPPHPPHRTLGLRMEHGLHLFPLRPMLLQPQAPTATLTP